jgi:hypothetical protein
MKLAAGEGVMNMKPLVFQIMGCALVAPFAFGIGFSEGRALQPERQAPAAVREHAGAAVAASGTPEVRPDEACFYSGRHYADLIGCVQTGESLTVDRVSVQSIVLGKHVAVANAGSCQFYGPDVAYRDTAASDCSTDRVSVEAPRSFNGT